jgi:calcyclin binding protein
MVSIEAVVDEVNETPLSDERLLDADDLERLLPQLKRPTAQMQLESLVKKIRKEGAALKVMEDTKAKAGEAANLPDSRGPSSAEPAAVSAPAPAPKVIPTAIAPVSSPSVMYTNIDRFSFDAGGYNEKFVTLYLPLPGVGEIPKDQIEVVFCKDSIDVTVLQLGGKNYRLKKDNLEHDIVPEKSKYVVKADKIVVKLQKVKGEYGSYDYWSKLTDPKRKEKKNKDPAASITDMMKEMYENGDDNMKKMIGETMLKQRNGELNKDKGMGDFGNGFDSDD